MTDVLTSAEGEDLKIPDLETSAEVEDTDQNVTESVVNPEEPRTVPDSVIKTSKDSLNNHINIESNGNENGNFEENKPQVEETARTSSPIQDIEMEQVPEETLKESDSIEEYYKMVKSLLSADPETLPQSYTRNSEKEEKVIDFVENFLRQYKQLFPNRKELFILPNNEWNVKVSQTAGSWYL